MNGRIVGDFSWRKFSVQPDMLFNSVSGKNYSVNCACRREFDTMKAWEL